MKKTILILIVVLVAVYFTLFMLGSRGEHAAEKLFYRASQTYNKIKLNPDVAPPKMIASVEKDLKKLIKKYPDTIPAKNAYINLAEIYMSDKKYDKAIRTTDDFISTHDEDKALLSKAHFLKGLAYERKGDWGKALKEFTILKDKYVTTTLGLQAPIYIANYYKRNGKELKAEEELAKAALFYENIKKEHAGTVLGYAASNLLVQAYMNLKQYEEAGRVVEQTIFNYPVTAVLAQQLPYVELIYVKTLKKPEKAIEIYTKVIEKTKDEKVKKFLQGKIKELESQK